MTTTEPTSPDLLAIVANMRERFKATGENLEATAADLRGRGSPPSPDTLEQLNALRHEFATVVEQARLRARELENSDRRLTELPLNDLADVEALGQLLREAENSRSRRQETWARAGHFLESIDRLKHVDIPSWPPLEWCRSEAKRLRLLIGSDTMSESESEMATLLAEKRHPLGSLMSLVERRSQLSDDEWEIAEKAIDAGLGADGKQLRIAATRGKLFLAEQPVAETARAESPTPPPRLPPQPSPVPQAVTPAPSQQLKPSAQIRTAATIPLGNSPGGIRSPKPATKRILAAALPHSNVVEVELSGTALPKPPSLQPTRSPSAVVPVAKSKLSGVLADREQTQGSAVSTQNLLQAPPLATPENIEPTTMAVEASPKDIPHDDVTPALAFPAEPEPTRFRSLIRNQHAR
jgi:hypothetical protein